MSIPRVWTADFDLPGEQLHQTITVREACKHNRYEAHKDWPPSAREPVWCQGFRQIVLRRPDSYACHEDANTVWVEVKGDE